MIMMLVLAVLTLLTLVAAFLGSKVWHWAHVLIVVALFFSTVGFAVLAAGAFKVRAKFMKQEQEAAQQIEPQLRLNDALQRGTQDSDLVRQLIGRGLQIDEEATEAPGLADLRHRLRLVNRTLGRRWRNGQKLGPPAPGSGQVTVQIENPQPLGINPGDVLFAFEEGVANTANPNQGPQYLAEFRVVGVNGQQVVLEPALALDPRELTRLARSQSQWAFYETMPVDAHRLFEPFTDQQLRQLLPAASIDEYIRDGQTATVDDDQWVREGRDETGKIIGPDEWDNTTKFVYRRKLRDYPLLFNNLAKGRIEMLSRIIALQEDNSKLDTTLTSAKRLGAYRTTEQKKLEADLKGVQGDRKAIETHLAALQRQVQRGRQLLAKTLDSNSKLAERLAQLQQAMAGGVDLKSQPLPSRGGIDVDAL